MLRFNFQHFMFDRLIDLFVPILAYERHFELGLLGLSVRSINLFK